MMAVDPERSTGVPLNPQYRNPPPGANPPEVYDDPVTLPAGDIAENSYFKRDARRNYPRSSVVKQADVVGLLTAGSKAHPRVEGGESTSALVAGKPIGLATYFQRSPETNVLGPSKLPPFPAGMHTKAPHGGKAYVMLQQSEQGYPEEYV